MRVLGRIIVNKIPGDFLINLRKDVIATASGFAVSDEAFFYYLGPHYGVKVNVLVDSSLRSRSWKYYYPPLGSHLKPDNNLPLYKPFMKPSSSGSIIRIIRLGYCWLKKNLKWLLELALEALRS